MYEQKVYLDIQTENAAIARRVYSLLKKLSTVQVEILIRKKVKLKKNNVYIVTITNGIEKLLIEFNMLDQNENINDHIPEHLIKSECCKRAYIRGAFLFGGSINNPDRSSYHLEMITHIEVHTREINELMNYFDLNSRMLKRKKGYICYVKEAEKISKFLTVIEAYESLFHFEDVRIVRDLRNSANRITNCDQANINKIVSAAGRQVDNIKLIEEKIGINNLPDKLQEVARIRLAYPEASLNEVCNLLEKDKISKSGIYHRLRKLDQIAEKLNKNEMT